MNEPRAGRDIKGGEAVGVDSNGELVPFKLDATNGVFDIAAENCPGDACYSTSVYFGLNTDLLAKVQEMFEKLPKAVTAYVMTTATLEKFLAWCHEGENRSKTRFIGVERDFSMGVRMESFETLEQCFDRMQSPREGENLQLVLSEDIPLELFYHPWLVAQFSRFSGLKSDN